MTTGFNEVDPAQDAAFPNISDFDPELLPAEPADGPAGPPIDLPGLPDLPDPAPPAPDDGPGDPLPGDPGDPGEVGPPAGGDQVDDSPEGEELLLEADAPEPEEITDIEIGDEL